MKKARPVIIIILVIALLAFIKIQFLTNNASGPANAPKGKAAQSIVTAYVVKLQKTENTIHASGTVLANEEVALMPEISGKVMQLGFAEGEKVSKGSLLVKINDADLQAQLRKTELQLKLAEEKEGRSKKLLAANGISQEEYDIALNQLNSLQADLEYTRALISKTEIRAPFDGVIGLKTISEGSYVSPAVKIAVLQQLNPVKIDFFIPEKYSGRIHKGDSVYFTLNNSDEKFKGSVYAIEPRIDMSTRTLQLRAICPNPHERIYPGAFAKIDLILSENTSTILVPTEAIIPELKGQKVFVSKNGEAQPQKVQIGNRTDVNVEVTSGLQAGDTVITTGIMGLKPGTKLKITSIK